MIFKKSVKQMLRTPITTTIFVLLFAASAFFICTGVVIWARNQVNIKNYENTFMTIGTVTQIPSSVEMRERYDSYTDTYRRRIVPTYEYVLSKSVLNFAGADYIIEPEHRPFYGAWCPDLKLYPEEISIAPRIIIEFTPLADCIANESVEVKIIGILKNELDTLKSNSYDPGDLIKENDIKLFCDHYNDSPEMLYAGKKYIACVKSHFHNVGAGGEPLIIEYTPEEINFSTQYTSDGEIIEDGVSPVKIQEVTEGFYDTVAGRWWRAFADNLGVFYETVPVIPTNNTELLLPFYNRNTYIIDGEDISSEEYEIGERVCLISSKFAEMNNLKPGDSLILPLYFANYRDTATECMPSYDAEGLKGLVITVDWGELNAEGEKLPKFFNHDYRIKGIYQSIPAANKYVTLGANAVIVPLNSVTESDENNIIAYGPMQDINTSFQIPNGSIEKYMEKWLALGNDDLQFTFYDRGYTQVQRGIENMKRISTLFLAVGGAMTLALVMFFCNLCISKNKPRTAIERMLGYNKKQSAKSLVSGFMLAAIIATVIGCGVSIAVEDKITDQAMNKEYYNTDYTIGAVGTGKIETTSNAAFIYCPAAGVVLILVTYIISNLFVRGNLKEEPLLMLGKKME